MKNNFFAIAAFLAEADPAELAFLTFDEICRKHAACPRRMNLLFYDNFYLNFQSAHLELRQPLLVLDKI